MTRASALVGAIAIAVTASAAAATSSGYTASLEPRMSPRAIAVDARGQAAVAGVSGARAFVRKLSADGARAVFTSWLGAESSSARTEVTSVAVDRSGNVYVTGRTSQKAFRVTPGAFRDPDAFAQGDAAVFVVKLSGDKGAVIYSALLAGGTGRGIGVDFAGRAWVAGTTSDPRLATSPDAFQSKAPNDASAFLIELDADGRHAIYATYIGGANAPTSVDALTVDSGGNVFLAGTTASTAFPTRRPIRVKAKPSADCPDASEAFAMKFGADHQVAYSTFIGGGCRDEAASVAVDLAGDAYVTGWTNSTDFPCRHGFQCGTARPPAAFVAKIAADGTSVAYSFLLNGTSGESHATSIAVSQGCAYVTGWTTSADFPRDGTWPTASDRARVGGSHDLFVAKVVETGDRLAYSHALGGVPEARATAIAIGSSGDLYVTGVAEGPFVMRLVSDSSPATARSTAPAGSAGDARSGRRFHQP
jgi:hypothetical protein